ncbi:MAG: peptide-methionine (S)-S-oxide reductase MsrA [Patescibacteria group bacterium]
MNIRIALVLLLAVLFVAGAVIFRMQRDGATAMSDQNQPNEIITEPVPDGYSRAFLAPGCFWCMEALLQETNGVGPVISGYAGGTEFNPTYEDIYKGKTSHKEAVVAYYDPDAITYREVLDIYLSGIDPTDPDGQFYDRGPTYQTAIFYETDEQKVQAQEALDAIAPDFNKPIAVELLPYTTFYQAEEYHQDFYLKAPGRYQQYSDAKDNLKERIWQEIQREQSN